MATVYLALNGVKVIPNFRIGNLEETISSLAVYPSGSPFALGALGCYKRKITMGDKIYMQTKMLYVLPSRIYIYGKLEKDLIDLLKDSEVPTKFFEDFRTISRKKEN